jgi:tetratricopeptide (TPR) repeat protein
MRLTKRKVIRLGVFAGSVVALALALNYASRYRESLEHGNSLYHEGQVEDASEVYRARVESESEGEAAYNLGTALMSLGSPEAEEYLRFATELPDSAAIQRAFYNLGTLFLTRAGEASEPALALSQLVGAVASGRAALRLAPGDENARWNLALAQILLDSLMPPAPPPEPEEEEPEPSEGGMVIPEIARLGIPRGREFEAIAGEDPGSLNEAEARALLNGVETDVETLIRGILWSRRPQIDPYLEPYPGGGW